MNTIQKAFSSGGCAFKKHKETEEVVWLLGKHSGYHLWVLPKGMIEEGETALETAVRETEEEIGVVVKIVDEEPLYIDEYEFEAELKEDSIEGATDEDGKPVRRVKTYQENESFESADIPKVTIHKTVNFYLMEYVSGDPKDHGWEMEDAGWFSFDEAMEKLHFEGEKLALQAARKKLLDSTI